MSATIERRTEHLSVRIPASDMQEIRRRAAAKGLSQTAFVIGAALDRLPARQSQLDELQERIERLESLVLVT